MTDPDRLSEDFTQWLIWHHGADTQCGALHRDSGLAITAGTPAALTEAMTHLETLLAAGTPVLERSRRHAETLPPPSRGTV